MLRAAGAQLCRRAARQLQHPGPAAALVSPWLLSLELAAVLEQLTLTQTLSDARCSGRALLLQQRTLGSRRGSRQAGCWQLLPADCQAGLRHCSCRCPSRCTAQQGAMRAPCTWPAPEQTCSRT